MLEGRRGVHCSMAALALLCEHWRQGASNCDNMDQMYSTALELSFELLQLAGNAVDEGMTAANAATSRQVEAATRFLRILQPAVRQWPVTVQLISHSQFAIAR